MRGSQLTRSGELALISIKSASRFCHGLKSWETTSVSDLSSEPEWLTIPALVNLLGMSQSRVRHLIDDKYLLAIRRDNVVSVPSLFLRDGAPVPELRGTLFVLADDGFTDMQAMTWLLEVDDSLGVAPIEALRAGRKAEVRRVAQALA
jgi:hypothetical protein